MTDLPEDDELTIYETPSGKRRVVRKGGSVVCDFCLAPDPPWTYPCGPVRIIGHRVINASDDPWGACDGCKALIEAGDIGPLVERMIKYQKIHHPPDASTYYPPVPIMRVGLRKNVVAFMAARTGPVERDLVLPEES